MPLHNEEAKSNLEQIATATGGGNEIPASVCVEPSVTNEISAVKKDEDMTEGSGNQTMEH